MWHLNIIILCLGSWNTLNSSQFVHFRRKKGIFQRENSFCWKNRLVNPFLRNSTHFEMEYLSFKILGQALLEESCWDAKLAPFSTAVFTIRSFYLPLNGRVNQRLGKARLSLRNSRFPVVRVGARLLLIVVKHNGWEVLGVTSSLPFVLTCSKRILAPAVWTE